MKNNNVQIIKKRITALLLFALMLLSVEVAYGQKSGDWIESTSHNDDMRGKERVLQYLPDGKDFVCVNGKNRYTRALYGSNTAWRLETSDRPIFATYVKGDCRNIRFRLHIKNNTDTELENTETELNNTTSTSNKKVTDLENTDWCETRYTPGKRSYLLRDKAWGEDAMIEIAVLASMTEEAAIWKVSAEGFKDGCSLEVINSDIKQPKLSRSGDMGVDPADAFDPNEKAIKQTLNCELSDNSTVYIVVKDNELSEIDGEETFAEYEAAREELAGQICFKTPDPFINTLGGALAVAADGIWGTEGVWLHGAVGWRMPLSGWRAAYTGDALGWHDRARTHFDNYAASQVTDVPCTIPHPAQDSTLALARSVKQWGTPQYSNGYICRNPQRNDQMNHYDMNLCYMDELLWHFNWTGDIEYAKKMWNVIKLHLAWEKMNYDPDDDGLYDAYACIWASDALYYNSGGVTHSSAYNYRANRLAAMIAEKIGENPTPYREEADKILNAINSRLWLKDKGHWAEFQDFMGHRNLHESAAVWTIYHAIDSDIADPFQSYLATRYIDNEIPHIPIKVTPYPNNKLYSDFNTAATTINADNYATISTSNWMPYSWSINNVAFAEVMHTALSYFEAGRADDGYRLLKSSVLDGMYLGNSPGNFGQISYYDAARGECYRDFGDPIGVASRVLIQGLYGVLPDAMNGKLLLRPGFPSEWKNASLHTPDIDINFNIAGKEETFTFTHHLNAVKNVELQLPALCSQVASVTVNGGETTWKLVENSIGHPVISITCNSSSDEQKNIIIKWEGETLAKPQSLEKYPEYCVHKEGNVTFVKMEQGQMSWWMPIEEITASENQFVSLAKASVTIENVDTKQCVPVVMDKVFNANVTDIFNNKYLSPRSPYTTLQLPVQGIGEWCHPLYTANIDDTGLRAAVEKGMFNTKFGIPFRTPADGQNIAYTSLWDNYPDSIEIPLSGKASSAYLLLAGSTNHIQCNMDNAIIKVYYKDGCCDTLPLINPINWAPIEQIFYEDGAAFNRHAPSIQRVSLKTGEISDKFGEQLGYDGANCIIDGGAAIILKMPLDSSKKLSRLVLETVCNEVVIGVMGITMEK